MAGVFPVPVKTSGRKQCTLYNGGKGIKRLGSPLMDDWCPDSQVVLAKKLLDEKCDLDVDQEENARLGVYWLVKASEQGHREATDMLSQCFETGQGICEQNYLDVRACLDTPHEEKVARRAAHKVFESMAGGEEFITSGQLGERMRRLADEGASTSLAADNSEWRARSEGGAKLTEDVLVSAATSYSQGDLPLVTASVGLAPRRRPPCAALMAPFQLVASSYARTVRSIGQHSISWYLPLTLAQLKPVVAVMFLLTVGLDSFVALLPTALYYSSIAAMVIATCQVLTNKQDLHHFRRWSNLFLAYSEGGVNAGEAEFRYCRNRVRPYAWFFAGLLAHLLLYPNLRQSLPQSELSVLAFGLTCLTVYNFAVVTGRRSPDWLALLSFAVHVLAKYPYETDAVVSQGWRFVDVHVPTFASYVVGNGVEFCLNFRALFYLVIPAILVKMAARDGWRGCYTSLVPHCLALSWWQIAVTASEGATWYGLIRSVLALAGLVLFLPLAGLASVLLPVAAAGKILFSSGDVARLGSTSLLALVPIVIVLYLHRLKSINTRMASVFGSMQILLCVLAAMLMIWPSVSPETGSGLPSLSWDQFQSFCPALDESHTEVNTNLRCSQLLGTPVSWEGRVSAVKVTRVSNPLASFVRHLPLNLQSGLSCFLGEPVGCTSGQNCPEFISRCHLNNWDRYEVAVGVWLGQSQLWARADPPAATLVADHSHLNLTRSLRAGDRIWFTGQLEADASGLLTRTEPRIAVTQIGCLSCHDSSLGVSKKLSLLSALTPRDLYSGLKTVLNFLFNPLVIFR